MENRLQSDYSAANSWTVPQKNVFRFFFTFLGTTSLAAYNIVLLLLYKGFSGREKIYIVCKKPLAWVDSHLLHIGFVPTTQNSYLSDSYYGWTMLATLFILSVILTIIWAIADQKRKNYNRLHYWFRLYLVYYMCIAMIVYALDKIIPVQMPYPNVMELIGSLGQSNRYRVMWNFIGAAPAYGQFTGVCELIACLLLLLPRTRVFGTLMMATILVNVVCMNFFYNIPVKILCSQLLLIDLFLMAPYLPKLYLIFYKHQPISLAERKYSFTTPWKRYLLMALVLAPAWVAIRETKRIYDEHQTECLYRKNERLYNVTTFIAGKDTLPPLLTDTFRWKRFAITNFRLRRFCVVYNMHDGWNCYYPQIDSTLKTITLIGNSNSAGIVCFHYSEPGNNKLALSGTWKGKEVQMLLDKEEIDSMPLVKEKTTWVHEY